MTPEHKAKELVEKYDAPTRCWDDFNGLTSDLESAKQCAIILCDEILNICPAADIGLYALKDDGDTSFVDYWEQVKQEIEKL